MEDLLENKTAIVYGAGSIGGAVAKAFAKAGATVFVADHNENASKRFADKNVQTEQVDVLDKDAVAAFVKSVVEKTGHVDISFCATSTHQPGGEQGAALTELSYEDFSMPIIDYTKATFNTANAVYPYMVKQHSGVSMGMTAVVSQVPFPTRQALVRHGQPLNRCFACSPQNWDHMAFVPSASTRLVRKARPIRRSPAPTLSLISAWKDGAGVG
jgi:NAD(P)-dependent dehydrogenase (short-subunit alcohol dehydrogenase family)